MCKNCFGSPRTTAMLYGDLSLCLPHRPRL